MDFGSWQELGSHLYQQGFSRKRMSGMSKYVHTHIYFKELADIVVEVGSPNCRAARNPGNLQRLRLQAYDRIFSSSGEISGLLLNPFN